ncbi:MAG: PD40 domain-containing protein [Opitutaceae bacterium]|nr:PD40 domain-containing protein [Cytophagales bacterium]
MRISFFLLIMLINLNINAQQTYSTKDKKAIKFYETGKQLIIMRRFPDAILNFREATEKDKNFVEGYIALAGCYRILRDDQNVKFNLLTAFSIQPNIPGSMHEYYYLSQIFMKEGDYKNAELFIDRYLASNPTDARVTPQAKKMKDNCMFAQSAISHPLDLSPIALPDPINTFQNQYFPSLTADGKSMVYTVRNSTGMLDEENLYISEKNEKGWLKPEQVSTRINTKENEGASSISGDGKTLVYTYCTPRNGCDLYITRKLGKEWLQPGSIPGKINTSGWESHPSLSADGRTLYFASDRIGGLGKEDIWVTKLDSNDNWMKPINLGPSINTPESDFTPFIHANGKSLYFASRGYPGMGGSDLFMSEFSGDSAWSSPKNLGYPLNTFADEMGFTLSSDFSTGYFSKDVINSQRRYTSTLYSFNVPPELKGNVSCIYIKGKVFDADTKLPLKGRIELINLPKDKTEQSVFSDAQNGEFLLVIPDRSNYGLFVTSKGYLYQSLNFNTTDDKMLSVEDFSIYLKPIKVNSTAALRNIFFETAKYDLNQTSETELNKLAKLIKENNLKIEVSGHTDIVGNIQDNQILSEKRAKAVFDYLADKKEINKKDLSFKGYGSSKPIGDNKTDEGKQQNRRIEIKILK